MFHRYLVYFHRALLGISWPSLALVRGDFCFKSVGHHATMSPLQPLTCPLFWPLRPSPGAAAMANSTEIVHSGWFPERQRQSFLTTATLAYTLVFTSASHRIWEGVAFPSSLRLKPLLDSRVWLCIFLVLKKHNLHYLGMFLE